MTSKLLDSSSIELLFAVSRFSLCQGSVADFWREPRDADTSSDGAQARFRRGLLAGVRDSEPGR